MIKCYCYKIHVHFLVKNATTSWKLFLFVCAVGQIRAKKQHLNKTLCSCIGRWSALMIVYNCSNKQYPEAAAVSLLKIWRYSTLTTPSTYIAMFLTDTIYSVEESRMCSHFYLELRCVSSYFVFIFIENTLFVQTQKMYSKLFHVYKKKYI